MKKINSISLLAVLTISGTANANPEANQILSSICNQLSNQENQIRISEETLINSEQVLKQIEEGKLNQEELENVCRFLKENENNIESDNSTIGKNNGMTIGV